MARATFEYTDDAGVTHRTHNVADVPKAYLHSMIAYGDDSQNDHSSLQVPWDLPQLDIPHVLQDPRALLVAVVAAIIVWRKSQNYLLRVVLCSLVAIWVLFQGYNLFEGSRFFRMDDKPVPTQAARSE